ncbi:hypothetical protein CAter282_4296 [Collimonas arenae]|uniref:IrrE N-terminal-like domain-containing protein n=2 Tax=Collimonas TaxID=202907 RepID=A0A127PW55_9BURK|nr:MULTISPECIES: ImmA/IrrE family metallo-endopeptidase [Collimonas]AMP02061.1 hypothetical protein CAter10_4671 [Collimonas arenae]AMP11956.1 hypothetical protein CAter282_4296 [Collimonas arenae]AMP17210.1 hypothetical protein CPter291_4997 [Collimonas pratensis]
MDEADVLWKARQFVASVDTSNIHVDLNAYVDAAKAKVGFEELEDGESGYTINVKGQPRITVNSLETPERQRFTICHEIAHIVLGLVSQHDEIPSWGYAKRDINETWCDVFAAELLMPYDIFRAKIRDEGEPSEELIESLASEFRTSFPAAGSRFAAVTDLPCAFVTIDRSIIRYASRSLSLRKIGAWIAPKSPVPTGSVAHRLRADEVNGSATQEVAQDIWFSDWEKDRDLWEMSRHYARFDQTVSLLWCDEDDISDVEVSRTRLTTYENDGLSELTGELPWPGKRSRR